MASSSNSRSTSTTETVRGEHRFDITRYSHKLGPGTVLTSDAFSVGGFDWAICYYPDVDGNENADETHVSVFVRLTTANATARALVDLRLVDRATGLPLSQAAGGVRREQGQEAPAGRPRIHGATRASGGDDDRLTVECVLDVMQEPRFTPTAVTREVVAPPPPELWKDLGRLMQTQVGADVAFDVQGEAFNAHRFVLAARSRVFEIENAFLRTS
ncbi:hypothetical protein EJB05_10010, partial [Eragrostis curvula]